MVVLGNVAAMSAADQSPNAIKVDEQDHYHEEWVLPFEFRDGVRIKTNQKFADYYELYEEIGEGKFGKVFRCVEKSTKLTLAAKCIRLKRDADLQKVEKEVNIMTHMRHKCIAQIYDAFATSTNEIILIMEIVNGGELFDRVVDDTYILTEKAVGMIVYQICEAIRYIHSQNIIHLDLKPENIMCTSQTGTKSGEIILDVLNTDSLLQLIDFGLAQYFDGQSDLLFMAGTPEFAAPEVIKYEPLDFHTDMWSLGVITYILLSGQSPLLGDNIAITYCNVERGKWEFSEEFTDNCISEEAKDFIRKLLVLDKNKRMLPKDCLEHPWILKCKESAKNGAFNSQITEGKQLDVGKLRSYVRNKRFRRLVFGVLFINTVVRMVSTLQEKKSEHGIRYVKDMLSAHNDSSKPSESQAGLLKAMFSKRRRNVTNSMERPSTSHQTSSGEELHTKPKRVNKEPKKAGSNNTIKEDTSNSSTNSSTPVALSLPQSSTETSGGEEGSSSSHSKEDKVKRVKSTTRKASSTEQAAKKLKTGGMLIPEVNVVPAEETARKLIL
uniref:Protein kinase domain-containing protein n=1 Tax=Ditylenchus dipsaci TaxID=166011 RepID=A0A915CQQ3_9BILA